MGLYHNISLSLGESSDLLAKMDDMDAKLKEEIVKLWQNCCTLTPRHKVHQLNFLRISLWRGSIVTHVRYIFTDCAIIRTFFSRSKMIFNLTYSSFPSQSELFCEGLNLLLSWGAARDWNAPKFSDVWSIQWTLLTELSYLSDSL